MAKKHTSLCVLMLGGKEIAYIRDLNIKSTAADVDTTTRADGEWENSESGRQSWEGSSEVFEDDGDTVHSFSYLENAKINGTVLAAIFKSDRVSGSNTRTGFCQVRSFDIKEPHGGVRSADITLKGKGALVVPAVPS